MTIVALSIYPVLDRILCCLSTCTWTRARSSKADTSTAVCNTSVAGNRHVKQTRFEQTSAENVLKLCFPSQKLRSFYVLTDFWFYSILERNVDNSISPVHLYQAYVHTPRQCFWNKVTAHRHFLFILTSPYKINIHQITWFCSNFTWITNLCFCPDASIAQSFTSLLASTLPVLFCYCGPLDQGLTPRTPSFNSNDKH